MLQRQIPAPDLHERDPGDGGTEVTLRLSYHAEGGLLGALADRIAAPIVGANLKRSLERLKQRLDRAF
jgi:hypothetical protein